MKQFIGKWIPNLEIKQAMYEQACEEISLNLKGFKRHSAYRAFIANDLRDEKTAVSFYQYIKREYPFLLEESALVKFQKNDEIGSPNLYKIEGNVFSPGTLRFMKVLGDILKRNKKIKSIIEIGSGYGGQCLVIKQYAPEIAYTLLDITKSLKVSKKYLGENNCPAVFVDADNIMLEESYDLCISDYCLSEFDIKGVKFYINEVLSKCKAAYITANKNGISTNLLITLLENVFSEVWATMEYPKTSYHNNVIIYCKK